MKKIMGLGLALVLTLSCNDKLWEELSRVELINKTQADALRELREANQDLQDELADTEAELNALIEQTSDSIYVGIQNLSQSIDSLQADVLINEDNIVALSDSIALVEVNVDVLDSLITDLDQELVDLTEEVESIEPIIIEELNEHYHTHVTNNIVEEADTDLDLWPDVEKVMNDLQVMYKSTTNCVNTYEARSDYDLPEGTDIELVILDGSTRYIVNELETWSLGVTCPWDKVTPIQYNWSKVEITFNLNGRTITKEFDLDKVALAGGKPKKKLII